MSHRDNPYIIAKIPNSKFQLLFHCIRVFKNFDMNNFSNNFKTLPFSTKHDFDYKEEQLDKLNKFIQKDLKRYAPLKKLNLQERRNKLLNRVH